MVETAGRGHDQIAGSETLCVGIEDNWLFELFYRVAGAENGFA